MGKKSVASRAPAAKNYFTIKDPAEIEISWLRQFARRLPPHRPIKFTVIPAFVTGFFIAYFALLRHPVFPVTAVPLLALDRMIGLSAFALVPYVSLWFYAFIPSAFLRGWSELIAYAIGATVVSVIGLGLFFFCPTVILYDPGQWAEAPAFRFLHQIDNAGNACPSLHVAFAVLAAIWMERLLRESNAPVWTRLLNGTWCAVIAYSTMATKQHVAVDVLAGTALGLAGGMWHPRNAGVRWGEMHPFLHRQSIAFALSLTTKLLIPALGLWPTHPLASLLLFFGPDVWILTGLLVPNTSWLMPIAREFVTTRKEVWLTIDDGPDTTTTRRMLDLLARHQARATFFVIGKRVSANPGLIGEMVQQGHTLGNHTHTHPLATFWLAGRQRTSRELDECREALRSAGAPPTEWFRAPAGIRNFFLRTVLAERGKVLVGWSGRGREHFSASPDQPLRRLKKRVRPGAILLLHSSASHGEERIALLAGLLDNLSAEGYQCVLPARQDLR